MTARPPSPPLVSVVITAFNHAAFLPQAIDSVMAQTHAPVELIIVDDGSTDDTPEICRRTPSARTIRQANAGLSAARNTGLAAARGDYITFLDADDLLCPDAVRQGLACFERHPGSAFVFGGHLGVTVDRRPLWEQRPTPDQACWRALLRANVIGMHATVLYRRDLLEQTGGFDVRLTACEDYDMYLRLARAHPIACHDAVIAEYRQHGSNMSGDPARMLTTALTVLDARTAEAKAEPADARALRTGLSFYQRAYGVPLLRRSLGHLRQAGRRREGMAGLMLVARQAPIALPAAIPLALAKVARAVERRLPAGMRGLLRRALGRAQPPPPVGKVRFGDLRRTCPIDGDFGFARGLPVDRFYIEQFLARHADAITGRVMEVGNDSYTRRFGGDRVSVRDVLHVHAGNPAATIVADLSDGRNIPSDSFDCIVLTQTLHMMFDLPAAVATLRRILKPGGTLLLTVPGISQIDRGEWGESWYWSLTVNAVRRLFAEGWREVTVESHGNVLSATAFLQGLATAELTPGELAVNDPAYPLVVTLRAVKPQGGAEAEVAGAGS